MGKRVGFSVVDHGSDEVQTLAMNRSGRLVAVGLTMSVVVTLTVPMPVLANVPDREQGGVGCVTDALGHAQFLWHAPMDGVAVFDAQHPAQVDTSDGLEIEHAAGGLWVRVFKDGFYSIHVTSTPSSSCEVNYAVDAIPTNDKVGDAELLDGSSGEIEGTTRAAVIDDTEPMPTEDALRTVWYRWSGLTGNATFTVDPHNSGGILDAGNGVTSAGVAVFDPADMSVPLAVGGDGVAPQDGGGTGGSVTVPVVEGTEYLVAIFSAGGTGTMVSQYGYSAAGRFTLSWDGPNAPPVANDDDVATDEDTPVTIDVLANDEDADGDPLQIVGLGDTAQGGSLSLTGGNLVGYEPPSGFVGVDSFTYDIDDGRGGTDQATVRVYVGLPIPGTTQIQVDPAVINFGAVPRGKTRTVDLTITSVGADPVGPLAMTVEQTGPTPFDATAVSPCTSSTIAPGNSCTQTIRFWSVDGAGAASPARLTIRDLQTDKVLAIVSLTGSDAPPVPPGTPNSDPVAGDDVAHVLAGDTVTLNALVSDYDPDNDILAITNAADPAHGVASVARCIDFVAGYSPHLDCIRYTPDDGFRGVDQIPYTISDGRGGAASATYWIAVDHPEMAIDSVDPSSGPPVGGQSVIVNGQNFMPTVGVQFICSGVSYPAPITAVWLTQLTVTTPPMPLGACDVHAQHLVLTGLASATLGAAYTVVSGDNHPPVAVDDSATVRQTNSVDVAVLANDSDPDGDAIHVVSSTQPAHGHLDSFAVDTYNYTPNAGYLGNDSFTYTIEDANGATATATVHIAVTAGLGFVRANVVYRGFGAGDRGAGVLRAAGRRWRPSWIGPMPQCDWSNGRFLECSPWRLLSCGRLYGRPSAGVAQPKAPGTVRGTHASRRHGDARRTGRDRDSTN